GWTFCRASRLQPSTASAIDLPDRRSSGQRGMSTVSGACQVVQPLCQQSQVVGFDDAVGGGRAVAGAHFFEQFALIVATGEQHRQGRAQLARGFHQFAPIHAGHADIAHQQIDLLVAAQQIQGTGAIAQGVHAITELTEYLSGEFAYYIVIFDQQNGLGSDVIGFAHEAPCFGAQNVQMFGKLRGPRAVSVPHASPRQIRRSETIIEWTSQCRMSPQWTRKVFAEFSIVTSGYRSAWA